MNEKEKAQKGMLLLQDAVIGFVTASERAVSHAEIVNGLGIHSDFEGNAKNYLSWSILGMLVNGGRLKYRGDRRERVYYVRDDQIPRG